MGILAFGPQRLLRWCDRCKVRGHNRRECKLPTIMIRCKENLNHNTVDLWRRETGATCGFMGSNPMSVNMYNKKFAFFMFPDTTALAEASRFFAAMGRLGAFQARPRCFMGLPEMCGACGLLKDEATKEEWHQPGDARCHRHNFLPCARGAVAPQPSDSKTAAAVTTDKPTVLTKPRTTHRP